MINRMTHHGIHVLDQDDALDFYVGKLGMEVSADIDLGMMRWLTVSVPGDDRHVLLEKPGAPGHDEATAAQIRDLLTKGGGGLALILTTDDARATHAELEAKGVEITQAPVEQPYGIDFGIRDPFGNNIRVTQPTPATNEEIQSAYDAAR